MNKSHIITHLWDAESFEPCVYQDILGFWTIGVGRLVDKRRGRGLTEKEGLYLLGNDIDECYKDLSESIFHEFDTFPDPIQTVLISMRFQLGFRGFRGFKKTIAAFQARDYRTAIKEMKDSVWYSQTKARADKLIKMVLG